MFRIEELGIDYQLPLEAGVPAMLFGGTEFEYEVGIGFVAFAGFRLGADGLYHCKYDPSVVEAITFAARTATNEASIHFGGGIWCFVSNAFSHSDTVHGAGLTRIYYRSRRHLERIETWTGGHLDMTMVYRCGNAVWTEHTENQATVCTEIAYVDIAEKTPGRFRFSIDGVGDDDDKSRVKIYASSSALERGAWTISFKIRDRCGAITHM